MQKTNQWWIEQAGRCVAATYNRYPIALVRGEGCRVWDADGKEYIDCAAGIAVCSLGHGYPPLAEAICKQAERLIHVSNLYHIPEQTRLACLLVDNSFAHRVFFCNSGAEANEGAIKLARRYHLEKGNPERFEIVTMEQSFHGRTWATIAATAQEKVKKGFTPLPQGFVHVPFGDIDALQRAIGPRTAAVMVEPIQGEGGVILPPPGYLKEVEVLCREEGILLVLDEVQTGMGRTGSLFAYEDEGVVPHVVTLAKGLGGGVPIGAVLFLEDVACGLPAGSHASTFGGNYLACAAGLVVVETLLSPGFLEGVKRKGKLFLDLLNEVAKGSDAISQVRGRGLMIGVEFKEEISAKVVGSLMDAGVLTVPAGGGVVRFLPPLVISEDEIREAVKIFEGVVRGLN
jgi:acetylornithine/N-succinyldiaminopimelate aminotransferase